MAVAFPVASLFGHSAGGSSIYPLIQDNEGCVVNVADRLAVQWIIFYSSGFVPIPKAKEVTCQPSWATVATTAPALVTEFSRLLAQHSHPGRKR